jgi:hypothetical protein
MHRPLYASRTANLGDITAGSASERKRKIGPDLNLATYEYAANTVRSREPSSIIGVISSYNINTYKGRIFSHEFWRAVPFELMPNARGQSAVNRITRSLQLNAADRNDPRAIIALRAIRLEAPSGRLKRLHVLDVEDDADLL